MFGFERAGADKTAKMSELDLGQIEASIKGTALENDAATLRMIETGFVSPNGAQQDPSEFIKQRLAILESGQAGASAAEIGSDAMVQHSVRPETEPRAELN